MLDTLNLVLFPIIWAMQQILELLIAVLGSRGMAIIGLSLVMAIVTYPLSRMAVRHERRIQRTLVAMQPRIAEVRRQFRGEERFHAIERIYADHRWHPIKAIMTAAGFLITVPLLISSMLLLLDYPPS